MPVNSCTSQGVQSDLFGCLAMFKVVVTHGTEEPVSYSRERLEQANTVFITECKNAAGYLATASIRPLPVVKIEIYRPDGQILKEATFIMSAKQF